MQILSPEENRIHRIKEKAFLKIREEYEMESSVLQARRDYLSAYNPFLLALQNSVDSKNWYRQFDRQPMGTVCVQAPVELFHAANLQPFRLCGSSFIAPQIAPNQTPALMCPMVKSSLGMLELYKKAGVLTSCVVPTTCDWTVKFPEMNSGDFKEFYFLELSHVKEGERTRKKWLEEIYEFKKYLEAYTNQKILQKQLQNALQIYAKARMLLDEVIRKNTKGQLAAVWLIVIANSLYLMNIETWCDAVEGVLKEILTKKIKEKTNKRVFLTGSPIFFPNVKMLTLLEEAGLWVCGDDLCSGSRILPPPAPIKDRSEHALLRSLAEKNHMGCSCPTFAQNDRRMGVIQSAYQQEPFDGVVFHVLKGCHPFDMESFWIEDRVRAQKIKFLRIETDYVREDSQNILTRLEAFRETL